LPIPSWLHPYLPAPISAGRRERWLACLGAGLGLLLTELLSRWALGASHPWFVAPMGATAVLLFAVPASPLAQPWSVVGGNTLAALIGVACALWLPSPLLAAAVAGSLAIAIMFPLRCLHPPSGAVALTAVIGGPAVRELGFGFALWPVALNSLLLVMLAVLFHRLSGRRYPHHPQDHARTASPSAPGLGVTAADLDAALAAHKELLDISQDDLESILLDAEQRAYRRRFGEIRCSEAMSPATALPWPLPSVSEIQRLFAAQGMASLPVVDQRGRLRGEVQWARYRADDAAPALLAAGHAARPDQLVTAWVTELSNGQRSWVPVLGESDELLGLLTQADLIAALYRNHLEQR